jgi:hypothetical protein
MERQPMSPAQKNRTHGAISGFVSTDRETKWCSSSSSTSGIAVPHERTERKDYSDHPDTGRLLITAN